jgi:[ribosomal protein S5]-alanine N-acetyltransferase
MHHLFLEGKNIYLRGLEEKDLFGDYFQWLNDSETCRYNGHAIFPNSEKRIRDYLTCVQEGDSAVAFAIIEKKTEKHIGNISLQDIDWISRNAEIAYIISKEYGGRGYGYASGCLVIQYAFERLNLLRVYCGTSSENIPMQKLAEKLGMKKEGERKKAMYKMGEYVDLYEYGIVRDGL